MANKNGGLISRIDRNKMFLMNSLPKTKKIVSQTGSIKAKNQPIIIKKIRKSKIEFSPIIRIKSYRIFLT